MIISNRRIINEFSGDFVLTAINAATEYEDAPGDISSPSLLTGNNTITPPDNAEGVTIIMPADNEVLVILKGANGDVGVELHLTDPTSLGLNSTDSFVLNVSDNISGIKLIWS